MSGCIYGYHETRTWVFEGPCVCHGELFAATQNRRTERPPTWLPLTAHVCLDAIRPALDLAAVRLRRERRKVPNWTQRAELEHVPLSRADRWIEEASAILREPALGLLALAKLERGAGNVVEMAAECAETLRDALLVLTRHALLLNEAARFHLYLEGTRAILVMGSRVSLSHAMRDFLAGSMALSVARWLGSGQDIELWFAGTRPTYAPAYRSALRDISVGFYAPCDAIVVPIARLSAPLVRADRKRHDFMLRLASRMASASWSRPDDPEQAVAPPHVDRDP
jgi:Arabinose-binding domain of AraC transcription regulator, N-term